MLMRSVEIVYLYTEGIGKAEINPLSEGAFVFVKAQISHVVTMSLAFEINSDSEI